MIAIAQVIGQVGVDRRRDVSTRPIVAARDHRVTRLSLIAWAQVHSALENAKVGGPRLCASESVVTRYRSRSLSNMASLPQGRMCRFCSLRAVFETRSHAPRGARARPASLARFGSDTMSLSSCQRIGPHVTGGTPGRARLQLGHELERNRVHAMPCVVLRQPLADEDVAQVAAASGTLYFDALAVGIR